MLTVHEVTTATDAKNYYAAADYYSQGQETVGRWGGRLAERLGLEGRVTKDAFDRLVDNRHPQTGERLTARTKENRRVGYDFTFSLNKSASILRAFAGPEDAAALDAARDAALAAVTAAIEADMQCRERRNGADHDVPTGNIVSAAFHHTTSRPVPGHAPDMNEHTHVLVFNATQRADGRILAGQFGPLKRDGEYYSAVFDAHYTRNLEELGFGIDRRGGKKWEVAGISRSMIDTFSKRRDEVEDEAARRGVVDAARKAALGAKTRSKKQKELTPAELRRSWDAQLDAAEREALAAVYRREAEGGNAVSPAAAVAYAIEHLSERLSVFAERDVKRVALLHGLGDLLPEDVDREMRAPPHGLIVQEIDGRRMATTERLQREEDAIIGFAARGKGAVAAVGVSPELERGRLNDGQWAAVTGLLESENRVNVLTGPAGAGKTDLLKAYARGMSLAGTSAFFLATSSDAVDVLRKDGFDDAKTVAHFLLDERLQRSLRHGHAVVDEASLLGHKDARRFFRLAEALDLKVTLVGDPMQHGSVPRGALLKILTDYAGIRDFHLRGIMRQKENPGYLAAVESLADGRTVAGFDKIDALGWVREIADDGERYERLAADYVESVRSGDSCLVVSPTHREAAAITREIRTRLKSAGLLGEEDREFTRLVAVNATEAERGLESTYRDGPLVLQFHQNAKGGHKKGDRLVVEDAAAAPLAEASKFSLYRPVTESLAAGDRVRFTGTVKTLDGRHALKNGTVRTVAEITPGGNWRLDNGWVVSGREAGHWRHGAVDTSFGAQGKTVRRVLLGMSASSAGAMNQEQMYVSASRGRERLTLYTDDKAAVRAAIAKSSQKLAAVDLRRPATPARTNPWRQHWERLKKYFERRKRLAYYDGLRPSRGRAASVPDRHPPGVAWVSREQRERRQEREQGHER